jgi:hypothetical protein
VATVCLLGQIIPFLVAGGVSLLVTVVRGEVMVTCHPWVRHLVHGLIPWDPILWLGEALEVALLAAVVRQATQTMMSLCLPER